MIISTLIAATVAVAEPAAPAQPAVAPAAPVAEKKMACCENMEKGEGCDCCKGMEGKDGAAKQDGHGAHQH